MSITQNKTNILPIFLKTKNVIKKDPREDLVVEIQKTPSFEDQLVEYNDQVNSSVAFAMQVTIDCDDQAKASVEVAGNLRKASKKIEAKRKEIIEPARDFISKINSMAANYTDKLNEAIGLISQKVGAFEHMKAKEKEEALAFLKVLSGPSDVYVPSAMPSEKNTKTSVASTYQVTEYQFVLECIKNVPLEYLQLNETAVKAAVKAGVEAIPGIKVIKTQNTKIRTN